MVKKIDVDKIFSNIKEFDEKKFLSAQWLQKEEWPLLVYSYDEPAVVSVAEAKEWLREDDYVLGVTVNDKARAYPMNIGNYYHQINDILDGVPILVND